MEDKKHRKPAAARREAVVQIRMTSAQKKKLSQAAAAEGLDLSAWMRAVALREADKSE